MLDDRIRTFLKLCKLMNYRKTAEALLMTQPAVTQHIHWLENEYGCRLFDYSGRVLTLTPEGQALERHARSVLYNEQAFRQGLKKPRAMRVAVGATKTVGDYTLEKTVLSLLDRDDVELELIIDNTENLLDRLNALQLDLLLIEGFFDKGSYGSELIRRVELVGICAPDHPFAGRTVELEELFGQHILLREEGSGTRAVFEGFLRERGYLTDRFRKRSVISSFRLIEQAVRRGRGISFVYESIPEHSPGLGVFRIRGAEICHEYNFVFLRGTCAEPYLQLFRGEKTRPMPQKP